jgi:hypothetical protein
MSDDDQDIRIQVWRCTKDGQSSMIVYSQSIAIDKFAAGFDIEIGVIIRHPNGDRTYQWGVIA